MRRTHHISCSQFRAYTACLSFCDVGGQIDSTHRLLHLVPLDNGDALILRKSRGEHVVDAVSKIGEIFFGINLKRDQCNAFDISRGC